MYRVRILDGAVDDLRRLDKTVSRRIAKRLNWLAENLDNIQRERLSGELSAFYKFRVGDYRIFYQVLDDEALIVVHQIGHRRDVYR
jgi:mRNA interferase RelE/StbE